MLKVGKNFSDFVSPLLLRRFEVETNSLRGFESDGGLHSYGEKSSYGHLDYFWKDNFSTSFDGHAPFSDLKFYYPEEIQSKFALNSGFLNIPIVDVLFLPSRHMFKLAGFLEYKFLDLINNESDSLHPRMKNSAKQAALVLLFQGTFIRLLGMRVRGVSSSSQKSCLDTLENYLTSTKFNNEKREINLEQVLRKAYACSLTDFSRLDEKKRSFLTSYGKVIPEKLDFIIHKPFLESCEVSKKEGIVICYSDREELFQRLRTNFFEDCNDVQISKDPSFSQDEFITFVDSIAKIIPEIQRNRTNQEAMANARLKALAESRKNQ